MSKFRVKFEFPIEAESLDEVMETVKEYFDPQQFQYIVITEDKDDKTPEELPS